MLRMNRQFVTSILLLGALWLATAAGRADEAASTPPNLLANGSFALQKDGRIADWAPSRPGLRFQTGREDGEPLITVSSADPGLPCGLAQEVDLRPEWSRILVRGYIRVTKLRKAPKADPSAGARVRLVWVAADGKQTAAATPSWSDVTNGWTEINTLLSTPAGAKKLIVVPEIAQATGSVDLRQLSVAAWVTTFDDEFNGAKLDLSRWTPTDSDHILYAPGAQYFAPDHVIVNSGYVRFHADNTPHEGYQWQSGEIRSFAKFQQLYGYWEFRVRMPVTEGTWPAFYLLRYDDGWPPEIDAMESTGASMGTVYETNHYADDYGVHRASNVNFPSTGLDRSQWHTYAICWEPGALAWYVDDIYRGTTRAPDARIPDIPMYIRFNLAIGGWGGDPSRTAYPTNMDCDWVRVYQRADMPLPLYPEPSVEITLPNRTAALSAIGCNPMNGVKVRWSLAEGPSGAAIADPSALDTKAVFTKPGMYRFTVTIAKGASSAARNLLVYVNPAPGHS